MSRGAFPKSEQSCEFVRITRFFFWPKELVGQLEVNTMFRLANI